MIGDGIRHGRELLPCLGAVSVRCHGKSRSSPDLACCLVNIHISFMHTMQWHLSANSIRYTNSKFDVQIYRFVTHFVAWPSSLFTLTHTTFIFTLYGTQAPTVCYTAGATTSCLGVFSTLSISYFSREKIFIFRRWMGVECCSHCCFGIQWWVPESKTSRSSSHTFDGSKTCGNVVTYDFYRWGPCILILGHVNWRWETGRHGGAQRYWGRRGGELVIFYSLSFFHLAYVSRKGAKCLVVIRMGSDCDASPVRDFMPAALKLFSANLFSFDVPKYLFKKTSTFLVA